MRRRQKFWSYANHVADRFGLRQDIQFNTRVEAAVFDEGAGSGSSTLATGWK
jgi:cyclohexanone monooxygenase